jgi:uncharacterized repeat protein (TIGR01451 family)
VIEARLSPSRIYAGDAVDLEVCLTNTGQGTCTNVVFTIRLPAGITRLGGRETTRASHLAPGRSHISMLRIRAGSAGRYRLTSPNFSYKDHLGQPNRDTSFAAELVVEAERDPLPEPQVTVELRTTELPYNEWSILRGRIVNHGVVTVSGLEIAVSGQVKPDQRSERISLEELPAGRSADVSFFVLAGQAGADVPVHLDLAYGDERRRYHAPSATYPIRVVRGQVARPPVAPGRRPSTVKILFLGAEPADTRRLRLGEEIREIQRAIQMGKERDNFEISIRPAVRTTDIIQALLDIEPRIVHFAGHGGGPDGSFVAEDEYGHAHLIPVEGLARLFKVAGRRSVECVIVNACSTERLARALSEHIPYTIGMRRPVGDRSAIVFSIGFYQGLAAGLPVEDAFDLGLAQITMRANVDWAAPLLLTRAGSCRR